MNKELRKYPIVDLECDSCVAHKELATVIPGAFRLRGRRRGREPRMVNRLIILSNNFGGELLSERSAITRTYHV